MFDLWFCWFDDLSLVECVVAILNAFIGVEAFCITIGHLQGVRNNASLQ
jgi:hypothetical protein